MENRRAIYIVSAVVAVFGLAGCADRGLDRGVEEGSDASGPLVVFVTNYPLKYFAERIGGEYASVSFPAPVAPAPRSVDDRPRRFSHERNA